MNNAQHVGCFVDLPTQAELSGLGGFELDNFESAVAFQVGHTDSVTAAMTAPHKLKDAMKLGASFQLIWDSGASICITNDKSDFCEGTLTGPGIVKRLTGLAKGMHIKGRGTVAWTVQDIHGQLRTLELPAYCYVPSSPAKLLSTSLLLQVYTNEHILLDNEAATLSGIKGDPTRTEVKAFVNPITNIPTCSGYKLDEVQKAAVALQSMTTAVDPRNINLDEAEKELLRWHQRFCHLDFRKIKFLLQSGVLCLSPSKRSLHSRAAKIVHPPGCAACRFGKQTVRSPKTKPTSNMKVQDRTPILKQDKLFPCQTVSIDHFVCSTKGVTLSRRGGASAPTYS